MIRDSLKNMIKAHEGWDNAPYKCSAGHWTIGWGHNMDANPLPKPIAEFLKNHGYILAGHAEDLLEYDIVAAQKACRRLWPKFDTFSERRQDALTDWVFNQGEGNSKRGVRSFKKANAAINRGDWETAAKEMKDSVWYYQVGNRSREICQMIREG
jgi:lysozyme